MEQMSAVEALTRVRGILSDAKALMEAQVGLPQWKEVDAYQRGSIMGVGLAVKTIDTVLIAMKGPQNLGDLLKDFIERPGSGEV